MTRLTFALAILSLGPGCRSHHSDFHGPDIRAEAVALAGKWNQSLKSQIESADRVEIAARWYLAEGAITYVVDDGRAVTELVDAIEVSEDHIGASNTGIGPYRFTFFRGATHLATVKQMSACLAWDDGLWVGTPPQTDESIRLVRAWLTEHLPVVKKRNRAEPGATDNPGDAQ